MTAPIVHPVFEPVTGTYQYVIADPFTLTAAIIDPVLDFEPARNTVSTTTADSLLGIVAQNGYKVAYLLETHAHADHLSASRYLQLKLEQSTSPKTGIGKRIVQVQQTFASKYGVEQSELDGVFDFLWEDNQTFKIGELEAKVVHLPGHTPDHVGYLIGENMFCGDSLFLPDVGSARCDFPGGDAVQLYHSVQTLFSLPPNYKIYSGHDYPPGDRQDPVPYATVAEQQERNKHLKVGTTQEEFVNWRQERDSVLGEPRLLHQSLQVNIREGRLPRNGMFVLPLKGVKEVGGVKL
ncbi:putative Zn-dependent hydrolase [Triangularia verruculosa]|uniref:Zn-dependent hydrolase n=1 Tax=Triangularia verruculosa TaxID=2587418 RepID=A0AAN6X9R8_9PEZI|nr:putative Zn-dependent hydrolase [Triangularia verruculosa]